MKHLVSIYGVDPKVLRPVGRGSDQLRDRANPESQVNRRVEMVRITVN
jgi:flagellar motor protein MotB